MSRKQASLKMEIARLERQLDGGSRPSGRKASRKRRQRRTSSPRKAGYMDMMDEEPMEEMMGVYMDDMMDEEPMMDMMDMMDEEPMMDMMMEEDLMYASRRPRRKASRRSLRRRRRASEVDPSGVEEEITQDSLSEVNEVAPGGDGGADADLVIDVAPTTASQLKRLKEASRRLDRLANYVESGARKSKSRKWLKIAHRIDQFGDAVDARIRQAKENMR